MAPSHSAPVSTTASIATRMFAHPVQRVEHPEQVDAAELGSLLHEMAHHVVGIVGVAHPVGAAQQHLEQDVGNTAAQLVQALPRVFLQESQRHVEGGAAPALEREQLRQCTGIPRGDGQHVGRAHAGGQQRLVRIAQRGVGHQHTVLGQHPLRESGRAQGLQALACAIGNGRAGSRLWQYRLGQGQGGQDAVLDFRIAIDGHLGQETQQLARAVAPGRELQQLGRVLDETCGPYGELLEKVPLF